MKSGLRQKLNPEIVLRLFIAKNSPQSLRALLATQKYCEDRFKSSYTLEVFDIYDHPELAKTEDVFAAPTLVRCAPLPKKKFLGDLSNQEASIFQDEPPRRQKIKNKAARISK